jgi:hypothetical protein
MEPIEEDVIDVCISREYLNECLEIASIRNEEFKQRALPTISFQSDEID